MFVCYTIFNNRNRKCFLNFQIFSWRNFSLGLDNSKQIIYFHFVIYLQDHRFLYQYFYSEFLNLYIPELYHIGILLFHSYHLYLLWLIIKSSLLSWVMWSRWFFGIHRWYVWNLFFWLSKGNSWVLRKILCIYKFSLIDTKFHK